VAGKTRHTVEDIIADAERGCTIVFSVEPGREEEAVGLLEGRGYCSYDLRPIQQCRVTSSGASDWEGRVQIAAPVYGDDIEGIIKVLAERKLSAYSRQTMLLVFGIDRWRSGI
jgi:hypothetical protein